MFKLVEIYISHENNTMASKNLFQSDNTNLHIKLITYVKQASLLDNIQTLQTHFHSYYRF